MDKIYPDDCRAKHPDECPDDDCTYCCEFYQTCDGCGEIMHNDTVRGVEGCDGVFCHQCLSKLCCMCHQVLDDEIIICPSCKRPVHIGCTDEFLFEQRCAECVESLKIEHA